MIVGEGDRLGPLRGGGDDVLSQGRTRRVAVSVRPGQVREGGGRNRVSAAHGIDEEGDLELPGAVAGAAGRAVIGVPEIQVPVPLRQEMHFDQIRAVGHRRRDNRELEVVASRIVVTRAAASRGGEKRPRPGHGRVGLGQRPGGGRRRRQRRDGQEEDRRDSRGNERLRQRAVRFHFHSFSRDAHASGRR